MRRRELKIGLSVKLKETVVKERQDAFIFPDLDWYDFKSCLNKTLKITDLEAPQVGKNKKLYGIARVKGGKIKVKDTGKKIKISQLLIPHTALIKL